MAEWFDRLTLQLSPADQKPIIVSDPHRILQFNQIQAWLKEENISIYRCEPGLHLRIQFELYGRGKHRVMFIVESDFPIQSDIATDSVFLQINLQHIFPHIDSKALNGLSFNALSTIDALRITEDLGYETSVRFLLENLYHIDLFALKSHLTKERALSVAISVFFHGDPPNSAIRHHLFNLLKPLFGAQIAATLTDRDSLREYLQGEWEKHSRNTSKLNFSDPLLEKSINQLFIDNELTPIKVTSQQLEEIGTVKHLGFDLDTNASITNRFSKLLSYIEDQIGTVQNQHKEWRDFSTTLGELGFLADSIEDTDLQQRYESSIKRLNDRFQIFLQSSYQSLQTTQGRRDPILIHQIMEYMRVQYEGKLAFLMIDGMSVIQWHILHSALQTSGIDADQKASLAWIPTITAWSRQSFFKGARPDLSTDNSKEESLFRDFWTKKGKSSFQINYQKFGANLAATLPTSDVTIAAFVCNDLDDLMHGTIMETQQLHQNTQLWIEKSKIIELIQHLRTAGFRICITADHGNICATGLGNLKLPDRQMSKSRSKRHIQCVNKEDAKRYKDDHPEWQLKVLEDSVYLSDTSAFTSDTSIITHGGSHLYEVIIP
jgi:hypothetical protein